MKITEGIYYVGVNDHEVTVFEGQYHVPNGMAYNSYVILDEKIAVMDTVDEAFGQQWMANVDGVLQGRKPDYHLTTWSRITPQTFCCSWKNTRRRRLWRHRRHLR